MWCIGYFDIQNRLGMDHQWDKQTDGQNYDSNSMHLMTRAKNEMHHKYLV